MLQGIVGTEKTRELSNYYGSLVDLVGLKYSSYSFSISKANLYAYPAYAQYLPYFDAGAISEPHYSRALKGTLNYTPASNYAGKETTYSTSRKTKDFVLKYNNFFHLKSQKVNLPFTYGYQAYNNPGLYYGRAYRRLGNPISVPCDFSTFVNFGAYDDASRRAWWMMQPRFEGEVSMLNFLFELKDFKDIAKYMLRLGKPSELFTKLTRLRKSINRIPAHLNRSTATVTDVIKSSKNLSSSAVYAASTAHLAYAFAVLPLISDLGYILAQAGQIVREVQQEFLEKGLEPQVRHYTEQDIVRDTLVPVNATSEYFISSGIHEKIEFTATLQYAYNYTMRTQSDAFLRYWGLKLTPEVIWNAIPFSFLIDYFYQVGQSLHAMSVDPNVKLLPVQYCESLLNRYSSGLSWSGDSRVLAACIDKDTNPSRGDIISGHTGTLYQRIRTQPNKGLATPKLRLPSGNQGVNMAALAICFTK